MKKLIIAVFVLFLISPVLTQDKPTIIETEIKVLGNCNMCKKRIEKAVEIKEVKYKKWNKSTKMLKLAFESTITLDSLQKRIAAVGHDNDKFKADNEVYKNLPECCLYRDNPNTH